MNNYKNNIANKNPSNKIKGKLRWRIEIFKLIYCMNF